MKYLVTAEEMKQMDAQTSDYFGLPSAVLMERAAMAVADAVRRQIPKAKEKKERTGRVTVFAGGGNNGADAVAAGRMLLLDGYRVRFVILAGNENASELLKLQVGIAERYGAKMERFAEVMTAEEPRFNEEMYECDACIDGLFGIGLHRKVEGQYADAVQYINACPRAYVVAVDMPSGIDTDTGEVLGCAVKADETVTFNFIKIGQKRYPGCDYTGKLTVADAGICVRSLLGERVKPKVFTFDEEDLPLTKRYGGGNKGTFGKALIVAGSSEVSGAAILAASGALHAGAGMVRLFTAAENKSAIQKAVPEALLTVYGVLPDVGDEEAFHKASASIREKLIKDMQWSTSLLIGCGIGTGRTARLIVKTVLEEYDKPIVMDADALNLVASDDKLRALVAAYGNDIRKWIIVTPHVQEFARLTGQVASEVTKELLDAPRKLSEQLHVTVLLKDARSVVAEEKEERTYLNTSGNAGMATAGSGDVLAGICTALIAEKESAFYTAAIASFLHGVAGDKAAAEKGERNMTASDIVDGLKGVLA